MGFGLQGALPLSACQADPRCSGARAVGSVAFKPSVERLLHQVIAICVWSSIEKKSLNQLTVGAADGGLIRHWFKVLMFSAPTPFPL